MPHDKKEQEKDKKVTSKSNTEVEMTQSDKPKSGLEDIQLNIWLYETERDRLTMAEILEQRKREAVGGDPN